MFASQIMHGAQSRLQPREVVSAGTAAIQILPQTVGGLGNLYLRFVQ